MCPLERMDGIKVLITGGLGFIGSNLAHKLVSLGADVSLYDNLLEGYGGNLANIREIKDKVKVVIGDVRDYSKLKEYVERVDVIYHCAAQLSRVVSMSNPQLDISINLSGTINVLEAAKDKHAYGRIKVIYTGSRAATGMARHLPVDEETTTDPVDIYGVNKLAAEMYCKIYHRVYGLETVALRLNNCYGPRAQLRTPNYGVINWFIRLALENKVLTVYKPGTMMRDYNYISDIVNALILAFQRIEAIGESFYLGSGKPIRLIDLANLIVKIAGSGEVKLTTSPRKWASIEIGDFYAGYAKIEKELGWKPETDIEVGLKKTIDFYKERLKEYC